MSVRNQFLTFLFVCLSTSGFAQTDEQSKGTKIISTNAQVQGTSRALVIGISNYKSINSLSYADRDARIFYQYLLSKGGGGFLKNNVDTLYNEQATAINVWIKIDKLVKESNAGDKVYIYFSGHGEYNDAMFPKQLVLLAHNCIKDIFDPSSNIGTNNLNGYVNKMAAKGVKVYLIVDACHSGGISGSIEDIATGFYSQSIPGWKEPVKMLSCLSEQVSAESSKYGQGRGRFSYYLLRGMEGLANLDDKPNEITLLELFSYMNQKMPSDQKPIIKPESELNSVVSYVDEDVLAQLKKEEKNEIIGKAALANNNKGEESKTTTDTLLLTIYNNIEQSIKDKRLISPEENSALHWYNELLNAKADIETVISLKTNVAAALMNHGQEMINEYLSGKQLAYTPRDYFNAAFELNKAAEMFGSDFIWHKEIIARKLFMEANAIIEKDSVDGLEYATSKLDTSISMDSNAAYTWYAKAKIDEYNGATSAAIDEYNKALTLAPTWGLPLKRLSGIYKTQNEENSINSGLKPEKFQQIVNSFETALQKDSTNTHSFQSLAETYADMNQKDKAVNMYQKAVEVDSTNTSAYYQLGLTFSDKEQYSKSIKAYKKALQFDKNNLDYLDNLAYMYYRLGQYDEAITYFKRAISINPDDYYANLDIAESFYNQDMIDSAIPYYHEAARIRPSATSPLLGLGNSFFSTDYEYAISYYKELLQLDNDNLNATYNIGLAYYNQKEYKKSLEWFNKVVVIDPDYEEAWEEIAAVYYFKKDYKSAISYYEKAMAHDPNQQFHFSYLKSAWEKYHTSDMVSKRRPALVKQLSKEPNNVEALKEIANLEANNLSLQSSIRYFKKLIKLEPSNPYNYYRLGLVYEDLGRNTEAAQTYLAGSKYHVSLVNSYLRFNTLYKTPLNEDSLLYFHQNALKFDTTNTKLHEGLAEAYYLKGQYFEAETEYQWLLDRNYANTIAINGMAQTLLEQKKLKASKEICINALKDGVADDQTLFLLGDCYLFEKLYDSAISKYRYGLRLHPTYQKYMFDEDTWNEDSSFIQKIRDYIIQTQNDKATPDTLLFRMGYYFKYFKYDKLAFDFYQRSVRVNPDYLSPQSYSAEYLYSSKDEVRLHETLLNMLRISKHSDSLFVYTELASYYMSYSSKDSAAAYFLKGIQVDDSDKFSNYWYAVMLHENLNKPREALKYYLKIYAMDSAYNDNQNAQLAACYDSVGDAGNALKFYTLTAEKAGYSEYKPWMNLIIFYFKQKWIEDGTKIFEKLSHNLPKDQMQLNYAMAARLASIGYKDEALSYLEAAFKNDLKDIDFVKDDHRLDGLRSDSRFAKLIKKYLPGEEQWVLKN